MPRMLLVLLVLFTACKEKTSGDSPPPARKSATAPAPEATFEPAPAGQALEPAAMLPFAIYHLPKPKTDPRKALEKLIAADYPYLSIAKDFDSGTAPMVIIHEPTVAEFAPPDEDAMQFFGRGITPEQTKAVQKTEHIFVLMFALEGKDLLARHRAAMELMLKLAERTGGLLWDESTRELFSRERWKKRITDWEGDRPEASSLFTIHSYRDGELIRMVTLGLEKFGLPDLVVNNVSGGDTDSMSSLINVTAQVLLSGGEVKEGGALDIDVNVSPDQWSMEKGATGKATLTLAIGKKEEGDAENRLWEIVFPGGPAAETQVRQQELLAQVFGVIDELTYSDHDEELLAASARAVKKIGAMKKEFQTAWPERERLLVKAPFKTDDGGNEWMWVEVLTWEGDTLKGILQNDPYSVSGLKSGSRVEVEFGSLFDYIRYHADGSQTGNGTGEILLRRQKKK